MKSTLLIFFSCIFITTWSQTTIPCQIVTSEGTIDLELYPEAAPVTVANFLSYIASKAYDNSSFFRVCTPENESERSIKIEVVQGGNVPDEMIQPPIQIETTEQTGILHKNGTISMARGNPNSATSSFFICIGDQPELDYRGKRNPDKIGFAAFGQVTKGMEVVKKIQSGSNTNQMLNTPVQIITIKRL